MCSSKIGLFSGGKRANHISKNITIPEWLANFIKIPKTNDNPIKSNPNMNIQSTHPLPAKLLKNSANGPWVAFNKNPDE